MSRVERRFNVRPAIGLLHSVGLAEALLDSAKRPSKPLEAEDFRLQPTLLARKGELFRFDHGRRALQGRLSRLQGLHRAFQPRSRSLRRGRPQLREFPRGLKGTSF